MTATFTESEYEITLSGAQGIAGYSAPIANNTVLANVSGSSAVPTATSAADMRTLMSAVSYASQSLTGGEQTQTRTNIGLSNVDNTSDANKPISTLVQAALDTKLNDTKELATYNNTSPAGAVHNTAIDSGENLHVDGPGQLLTTSNGTYITSSSNAYLCVDTGEVVTKVVQNYSGGASPDRAVTAFFEDLTFVNMIHCEFVSGGGFLVTLWVEGSGTGLAVAASAQLNTMPTMNDNTSRELVAIIDGDYVCGYCDGVLIGVAYDSRISSLSALSNQYYIQITRSTTRIYDWQSYKNREGSTVQGSLDVGAVKTGMLHIGASAEVSYTPENPIYAYMGANGASATALFEADNGLDIKAKNGAGGSGASFSMENQFGYVFQMIATTSVTAEIRYRGVVVVYCDDAVAVTVKSNSGQPIKLSPGNSEVLQLQSGGYIKLTGLPTSNPGVTGQLWNDGGTLKIS